MHSTFKLVGSRYSRQHTQAGPDPVFGLPAEALALRDAGRPGIGFARLPVRSFSEGGRRIQP
jgi:hypothetical protein